MERFEELAKLDIGKRLTIEESSVETDWSKIEVERVPGGWIWWRIFFGIASSRGPTAVHGVFVPKEKSNLI